ncbi:MAG: endonuclease 8 [marine bacterium B5-7]|nr:MAG: endonuclease 8 [marine bacterium B5-7]
MPEGPEIKRVSNELATVLCGQVIERVEFGLERLIPAAEHIEGYRVLAVESRGKALLTRFNNGYSLYSHNQLYGRWYIVKRGEMLNTQRSLRVALHTKTHSAILYSASDIELLRDEDITTHPFLSRIGPDILDERLDWRTISNRLIEPRFAGRSLAGLYLDQHFLAGVGNYLRSEILFFSRLNPGRKPASLTVAERGHLARTTLDISLRSFRTGGITNLSTRVKSLEKSGMTRSEFRFAVFSRDGKPCYDCGELIKKDVVSSRRIYFCPSCQGS